MGRRDRKGFDVVANLQLRRSGHPAQCGQDIGGKIVVKMYFSVNFSIIVYRRLRVKLSGDKLARKVRASVPAGVHLQLKASSSRMLPYVQRRCSILIQFLRQCSSKPVATLRWHTVSDICSPSLRTASYLLLLYCRHSFGGVDPMLAYTLLFGGGYGYDDEDGFGMRRGHGHRV